MEVEGNDEVLAVLRRAREYVSEGWCRTKYTKLIGGNPHYCAVGAVHAGVEFACQGMPKDSADEITRKTLRILSDLVMYEIKTYVPYRFVGNVTAWNDRQSRKHPVLRLFDRAIAEVEGKRSA